MLEYLSVSRINDDTSPSLIITAEGKVVVRGYQRSFFGMHDRDTALNLVNELVVQLCMSLTSLCILTTEGVVWIVRKEDTKTAHLLLSVPEPIVSVNYKCPYYCLTSFDGNTFICGVDGMMRDIVLIDDTVKKIEIDRDTLLLTTRGRLYYLLKLIPTPQPVKKIYSFNSHKMYFIDSLRHLYEIRVCNAVHTNVKENVKDIVEVDGKRLVLTVDGELLCIDDSNFLHRIETPASISSFRGNSYSISFTGKLYNNRELMRSIYTPR